MYANITPIIRGGTIDNTQRGTTILTLLSDFPGKPLEIRLKGDCLGEAAGRRTTFTAKGRGDEQIKPDERKWYRSALGAVRQAKDLLLAGDISITGRRTPSGRVSAKKDLYVEFFIGREMRLLVEGRHFACESTPCEWKPSPKDTENQRLLNLLALRGHVVYNAYYFAGPALQLTGPDFLPCKWDYVLNRAEAYMNIASTISRKFPNTPEGRLNEAFVLDLFMPGKRDNLEQEKKLVKKKGVLEKQKDLESLPVFFDSHEFDVVMDAMSAPLYMITHRFLACAHDHYFEQLANGEGKSFEITLFAASALASHTLATLMLISDDPMELDFARRRFITIMARSEELLPIPDYESERRQSPYTRALNQLLEELERVIEAIE